MPAPKGNKFAEGNNGGRPTKLTPEIFESTQEYFESCKDHDDNKTPSELPTTAGLAVWLHVSQKTIFNWAEGNEEFLQLLGDLNAEQEKRLINKGLLGEYNSNLAKFILSARHEYREKTDTDITSGGEPLIPFNNDQLTTIFQRRNKSGNTSGKGKSN